MPSGAPTQLLADFRARSTSEDVVRVEGFHALKHALRFGAEVHTVLSSDPAELDQLASLLAPDVQHRLRELTTVVSPEDFASLGRYAHHTRVVALATRPAFDVSAAALRSDVPTILLEDPRHLGNLGAVVRLSAAADAAAVLTTGERDPWDPVAVRGSAGLHFALPVGRLDRLDQVGGGRPLLALDPEGDPIDPSTISADAVLAFGTERHGLSSELLERADRRLSIPMRAGVSSLNLATSVSAVLFAWRLCANR